MIGIQTYQAFKDGIQIAADIITEYETKEQMLENISHILDLINEKQHIDRRQVILTELGIWGIFPKKTPTLFDSKTSSPGPIELPEIDEIDAQPTI